MIKRLTIFVTICLCQLAILGSPALAQNAQSLVGRWVITVTNVDNPSFSAVADVKYDYDREIAVAVLIAQDSCCDGQNYAKVKQQSVLSIFEGQIFVRSKIETFLELKEGLPNVTYNADNFDLTWENRDTLVGTLNNTATVQWVRGAGNIS